MPRGLGVVLPGLLGMTLALCACNPHPSRPAVAVTEANADSLQERKTLNQGYSLLYEQARGLARLQWLIRFKQQSTATRETVTAATAYYRELADDLERMAADYPALQIDVRTMLPLHRQAREAIVREQIESALPLIGDSGTAYERGILMAIHMALNEQRHLAKLLARDEPDVGLRGFMQLQSQRLQALYHRFDQQLQRDHFRR